MNTQGNKLTAIADAIREKDGTTEPIVANDFPARIRAIQTGVDTSDATATADDIAEGKTAYVDGEKITGSIAEVTATDNFYLNNGSTSASTIINKYNVTASPTVSKIIRPNSNIIVRSNLSDLGTATAAKVASGQTFSSAEGIKVTGTAPTQVTKTWTPTTSNQTIASGTYLTGTQTIKGDSNLVASNIKQGVTIFGITGTYGGTSATARYGTLSFNRGMSIVCFVADSSLNYLNTMLDFSGQATNITTYDLILISFGASLSKYPNASVSGLKRLARIGSTSTKGGKITDLYRPTGNNFTINITESTTAPS